MFKSNNFLSLSNARFERDTFLNEMNNLLDQVWNTTFITTSPVQSDLTHPKYNAYTKGNALYVDIFVPYVKKEHLDIDANEADNTVTVFVKAHQDSSVKESDYFVRQISRGSFKQTFTFDSRFPVKEVKADLKDGILQLVLPYRGSDKVTVTTRKVTIG